MRRPIASRIVTTGVEGEFVARDLALGDYRVLAAADGYTPARRFGSTIDQGQSVVLSTSRPDGAATMKHSRVGSIAGVVTDDLGAPLAGACVRILHHVVNGAALLWQPMPVNTFTDRVGRYAFTNTPPGDYIVGVYLRSVSIPVSVGDAFWRSPGTQAAMRARLADSNAVLPLPPTAATSASNLEGYRWTVHDAVGEPMRTSEVIGPTSRLSTTFHGASASVRDAQVIRLAPGEARSDANIQMRRTMGFRVAGTLTGTADQIAHVGLRLLPAGESDVLQTFPGDVAATVTDAAGRFMFISVPSGRMVLDAVITTPIAAPDGIPRRSPAFRVRQTIDVGSSDVIDLRVPVRGLLSVRGRLEFKPEQPGPNDPKPPATAVALVPVGARGTAPRARAQTVTEFAFDRLTPGRFILSMPAFGNWRVRSITIGGTESLHRAFDLDDADIDSVVVTLTTGVNRLTGRVVGPDGLGLEGSQVVLFPADYETWFEGGRAPSAGQSVIAGPRGAYTITGLTDGEYVLLAFSESVENDWRPLSALAALAPLAQRVRIEGGRTLSVDIRIVLPDVPAGSLPPR